MHATLSVLTKDSSFDNPVAETFELAELDAAKKQPGDMVRVDAPFQKYRDMLYTNNYDTFRARVRNESRDHGLRYMGISGPTCTFEVL